MKTYLPITVIIPTYNRSHQIIDTIAKILECDPLPNEFIVHIDGNDNVTKMELELHYPEIKIICSENNLGPGGGRNKCINISTNNIIASFDDDSYPVNLDYFTIVFDLFDRFKDISIFESNIYHKFENMPIKSNTFYRQYLFTGCGVAYRKNAFLAIGGYVPISVAYGMEEVDFSLRAHDKNFKILRCESLIVFHNTNLYHHNSSKINAGYISNIGLLIYLRYPLILWPLGMLQIFNRVFWSFKNGRYKGVFGGLISIPVICKKYSNYRNIISSTKIKEFMVLRKKMIIYEIS